MYRASLPAWLLAALLAATSSAADPAHDICDDLGQSVPFGVSSFGSAGDWLTSASEDHGVDWGFVYVYLTVPDPDDLDGYQWFIEYKHGVAASAGAIAVFTFYQLLHLGQQAGYTGDHEADVVAQALADADVMYAYFENFAFVLDVVAGLDPPALIHVEPDSWGFMSWAMGVEGNADATTVFVQVDGSGHPDAAGFADHAGGLGQALLAMRDARAPEVRLGWHASNFRTGLYPEVTAGFYAAMGEWDVLVGEHPHLEPDETTWWEPWDADAVETNLDWFEQVTEAAGVPILLWQLPIGTTDWHLLGDPGDLSLLERFAAVGVGGFMLEHQDFGGYGDPDDFRAAGDLGTVPPGDSGAGGTATDLRDRLAAYSDDPLPWPDGSFCAEGSDADSDSDADTDSDSDADADGGGAGSSSGCDCGQTLGAGSERGLRASILTLVL